MNPGSGAVDESQFRDSDSSNCGSLQTSCSNTLECGEELVCFVVGTSHVDDDVDVEGIDGFEESSIFGDATNDGDHFLALE